GVDLVRGDAEVEESAGKRAGCYAGDVDGLGIGGVDQPNAIAEAGQATAGLLDRVGVAVDADEARGGPALQQRLGVAATAQRTVEEQAAALRLQEVHRLRDENRLVVGGRAVHSRLSRKSAR